MSEQLYNLVRISRGKRRKMMTDNMVKVRSRLRVLKDSQRGMNYTYVIEPAEADADKYKKKHKHRSH